nr:calcium/proton exchanger [Tanacetum cinerariifolium]
MSYDNLRELVGKLVHAPVNSLYYCKVRKTLKQGLCLLENDVDVQEFLKAGYESKWVVDLYVEHHGYDPMDYKNSNARDYESSGSSDTYCSSDDEHVINYVDFYHEGKQDVIVKNITTNDPFLTKLCSNNGNFRGFINEPIPFNEDLHIEDPDSSSLEPRHQIQRGIAYPRHDPLQPWNKMQPILGTRYDHPEQLKLALANYEVADGYQLWFIKNDWRELLVYCSRDVSTGRCATKSKIASSGKNGQPQCGFRLWASWMSTENSFQIKTLKAEHKPLYFFVDNEGCNEKIFAVNVSLGQCKRAKHRALYDFEDGLIEHYARLWEYRHTILDTNLGCGRVIVLDGCFLKHTCRGELLTAIEKDANNQMYHIAWAVVKVKNAENWCWFISLLVEDLELSHGTCITVISDSHKTVIPSGFQELKVRQGDQSFGVNLHLKKCMCKLWELSGHNRKNCDKEQLPKPPQMKKQPGRKREPKFNSYDLHRGGGRGFRGGKGQASGGMGDASGGRGQTSGGLGEESVALGVAIGALGEASGGIGQSNAARFQANTKRGESSGGRGRAIGRGGRSGRDRGRGDREEIRKNMEHEYMKQILIKEEEKTIIAEKAIQEEFDEEAVSVAATETTPKGKTIEADAAEPPKLKKQGRKRKVAEPSAAEPPFRIYHKNRGRSERIFNQKIKKTGFGPNGEGFTADKAGYESKWVVDLYVEHHGFDPMDYKNSNARDYESSDSSDAYCSNDDE